MKASWVARKQRRDPKPEGAVVGVRAGWWPVDRTDGGTLKAVQKSPEDLQPFAKAFVSHVSYLRGNLYQCNRGMIYLASPRSS